MISPEIRLSIWGMGPTLQTGLPPCPGTEACRGAFCAARKDARCRATENSGSSLELRLLAWFCPTFAPGPLFAWPCAGLKRERSQPCPCP